MNPCCYCIHSTFFIKFINNRRRLYLDLRHWHYRRQRYIFFLNWPNFCPKKFAFGQKKAWGVPILTPSINLNENFKWTEGVVLKSDIIAFFRLQNYKDFLNPPNFLRKIFLFSAIFSIFSFFFTHFFLPQNNSKLLLRARLPRYSYICWHFLPLITDFWWQILSSHQQITSH